MNHARDKLVLVLVKDTQLDNQFGELVKSISRQHKKVCFVCLDCLYRDVVEKMRENKMETSNFFFIDILSSHYSHDEKAHNCMFLYEPITIDEISKAVKQAINKLGCCAVLFIPVSSLLQYESAYSIIKFTHSMATENAQGKIKKVFVINKEYENFQSEIESLTKDLSMFADKTLDFSSQ